MKKNLSKLGLIAVIFAALTFAFTSCNKKSEKT